MHVDRAELDAPYVGADLGCKDTIQRDATERCDN